MGQFITPFETEKFGLATPPFAGNDQRPNSYLAEAKGFQTLAFGNFFDSHHHLILSEVYELNQELVR